ncbi:hypothetical protein T05_4328 [Trichinella murrelli]|uniref:Uncharacterized protein n=1 Tax=Trichinella murrelli TaxID=144512 RepID=A0A0V0TC01_9BILA|nr:hypothetical protein T05_4328 [Trichinella murrelli]
MGWIRCNLLWRRLRAGSSTRFDGNPLRLASSGSDPHSTIGYDCTLDVYDYEHYNRSSPTVIRMSPLRYVRVHLSMVLPYRFSLYFLCILFAHTALALRGALHGPIYRAQGQRPRRVARSNRQ